MKLMAVALAMIGCLWQVPTLYGTYLWCRAGHPKVYRDPTGNEPHAIRVSEWYWRWAAALERKDPSLWNNLAGTDVAIESFKDGATRRELVREGIITEENPIRSLTSGEQIEMAAKLEQWTYYNRWLGLQPLGVLVAVLAGLPWLVITLGCTAYWGSRREFSAILIAWTIPILVLVITPRLIRMMV